MGDEAKKNNTLETNPENTKKSENKAKEKEKTQTIIISKEEFERLKKERDEYLENWKRERAEKINYKNAVEKRMRDQLNRESSRVLVKLLQVSDNFARALEESKGEIPEAHYEGFRLIHDEIKNILSQEGIEEIIIEPGKTLFDPAYHEALYTIETTEYPDNTIAEVVFRGYLRNGYVIKPAKVAVYKKIEVKDSNVENKEQRRTNGPKKEKEA